MVMRFVAAVAVGFPIPAQHVPNILVAGTGQHIGPVSHHRLHEFLKGTLPVASPMFLGEFRERREKT